MYTCIDIIFWKVQVAEQLLLVVVVVVVVGGGGGGVLLPPPFAMCCYSFAPFWDQFVSDCISSWSLLTLL